jgi:hypothetical protein
MNQTKITFRVAFKPAGFMTDATRPWTVIRTQTSPRGTHEDAVERYETKAQASVRARNSQRIVNDDRDAAWMRQYRKDA